MQPRAFGDIYYFTFSIGTDENLLQTKLAETSLLFSKFCNSSTNTFEISIKKCLSLWWIFEINVFQEVHLWKQTLAIRMLKVVDITTWNLTYLA